MLISLYWMRLARIADRCAARDTTRAWEWRRLAGQWRALAYS